MAKWRLCVLLKDTQQGGYYKNPKKPQKWVVHSWSSLWIQSHVEQHVFNFFRDNQGISYI